MIIAALFVARKKIYRLLCRFVMEGLAYCGRLRMQSPASARPWQRELCSKEDFIVRKAASGRPL